MNFSFDCPEDWFIHLCTPTPGSQRRATDSGKAAWGKSSTSQELEPDAEDWEFINHDLWVVRQHYKVQIALHQIGFFSAYAIFGISDTAAEKSTEHLIPRDIATGRSHMRFPGTGDPIKLQSGHMKSSFFPRAWQDSRVTAKEGHISGGWHSPCQPLEE